MTKATELRLLGTVRVQRDGEPVHGFRSRKALAVLCYLAVQGHPIPREQLVDVFWGDQPESRGRANLSWVLSHISTHLPDSLATDRHTVQFRRPNSCWVDIDAFDELTSQEDPDAQAAAMELFEGEFLEGLYLDGCPEFEIWAVGERERWRQRVEQALESLIAHHSCLGEYERGLEFARRLLALEPWREEAHRQTMLLLAHSGQRGAALAQYKICCQVLAEELKVEPAEATTTLYERIRAADTMSRHNLPASPTPFFGREEELAHIDSLLGNAECRLLTIAGPGGIGKTRLALQAAAARTESFLEGVCFVPLAAVGSADALVPAIAEALQLALTNPREPQAQLVDYLRSREVLLVLDSFEHLLQGTALLADILEKAPQVKLLVTSRECLNLRWEWRYEIQGLAYPDDGNEADDGRELVQFSAVQLLLQAARRTHPAFSLSGRDRPAVVRICQLVEGMPLGLELAAAQIKTRACEEIADDIESNLGSLAASFRDMPRRQRSLRATFDHSWRLLSPSEQSALAQLSVFRGGFRADAAGHVTGAASEILESLVSKSLLRFAPATGRFEMHELSRQFAAERLATVPGVEQETRGRHSTYYVSLLQLHAADLAGAGAAEAQETVGAELANVRTAWHWAAKHAGTKELGRGLDGLSRFLLLTGLYREGEALTGMMVDRLRASLETADRPERNARTDLARALAERARFLNRLGVYDEAAMAAGEAVSLARKEQMTDVEAMGCLQRGEAMWRQGELDEAQTQLEEALALARAAASRQVEADTLRILGNACYGRAAYVEARVHFERALFIYHELGDGRGEGGSLNNLGTVCQALGDNAAATEYYEQALTIYRHIGDRQIGGAALHNLARVSMYQGAYSSAREHLEQALQIWRDVGDRQGEGWGLLNLGCTAHEEGDYAEAQVRCEQALRVLRDIGDRRGESNALIDLGRVLHRRGGYTRAATCLEQALLICCEVRDRQGECWALRCLGNLSAEIGSFAEAEAQMRQALGICQEISDRKDEGEMLADLCLLFLQMGDAQRALEHGRQALLIAQELGERPVERTALTRLACALAGVGRLAEAAEAGQRALELSRELGEGSLVADSLAALARVSLTEGNLAQAQSHVDEILAVLEDNSLESSGEPFRVYMTCHRVLRENQDPRARQILADAHRLLRARAARIADDELRRSFLEDVAAHREVVEAFERLSTD